MPSPELYIMVLYLRNLTPHPTGSNSRVALLVLECFLTENVSEERKWVFG